MGVFSEIAMEQQNSMFDSSAAFEDDEAFELEEMESLPVPPVGTDTVPVSAASVSAGETALADAEEEPADEVAGKRSLLRRGIRHNRPPQKMKKKSVRSMRRLKPSAKRNLTPNSRRRKPRSRSKSPVWKR